MRLGVRTSAPTLRDPPRDPRALGSSRHSRAMPISKSSNLSSSLAGLLCPLFQVFLSFRETLANTALLPRTRLLSITRTRARARARDFLGGEMRRKRAPTPVLHPPRAAARPGMRKKMCGTAAKPGYIVNREPRTRFQH